MSVSKFPLFDLIVTVPKCQQTATLADVLEIFQQQQCAKLVVLDEQEHPIGVISCVRLLPQLVADGSTARKSLDLQKPLLNFGQILIEQIQTLPVDLPLKQLGLFLRSQSVTFGESLPSSLSSSSKRVAKCVSYAPQSSTNTLDISHSCKNQSSDWVITDSDGKFLGLLDSVGLFQLLAKQKLEVKKSAKSSTNVKQLEIASQKVSATKPLIQLLERLPWPLMLQTSNGQIVTQNPAWWQQLGVLKDPEGIRQQVEDILTGRVGDKSECTTKNAVAYNSKSREYNNIDTLQLDLEEPLTIHGQTILESDLLNAKNTTELPQSSSKFNRCFLDSQLGTCICVAEVQNGQERVWKFAKIPLSNPDSNSLNNDLWLVLATDVTEQQQLCKELAAKNADLIQLNRLKDEFLACISHELKTPLTAVLGLSRLLVDQQLGQLNERQARYAGLIHQSGRHLMSVVNDILDLTRMETGQMELTLTPVSIRTVCDRALSEAKTVHTTQVSKTATNTPTASPQHKFTLSVEPGLDKIVADELRLRQMLVHLLSNAFKFTETCGEIGLVISRWEGWIAFTVWDTGIGIPEHQQHLIFQKFQQLENPLTRQFEGTGLGLVLTRALARLHGGDVSFLSSEGRGSQFTLLLPPSPPKEISGIGDTHSENPVHKNTIKLPDPEGIAEPTKKLDIRHNAKPTASKWLPFSPTSQESTKASESSSSHRLILVVEAVSRYIENITEHLAGLGYRVVIARSGCEAVEKARRLQPKAIFVNPLLPLLSGWDVLTLLKSDQATRHIPVIVTATAAEKKQAFANRADGFLSLPVQHQLLTPMLESLCTTPEKQRGKEGYDVTRTFQPLRILRLVNPLQSVNHYPSLHQHRVIEVDDLEQAEMLARVWQFDVALLDTEIPAIEEYLQQLCQHSRLAAIPLVTCDVETTQAASQISGLSVFPCLTPFRTHKTDALSSVLQIAAGICCSPSILVVDLTMLPDLPGVKQKRIKKQSSFSSFTESKSSQEQCSSINISRGSEWFQALLQYLQTAGLKATMSRCWAELLQQIRHQSVDLILICLGESPMQKEVLEALVTLNELPFQKPPVLVVDQGLHSSDLIQPITHYQAPNESQAAVKAIATQVLPRSISMEDLLYQINQTIILNS